jgi:hypothetical protein
VVIHIDGSSHAGLATRTRAERTRSPTGDEVWLGRPRLLRAQERRLDLNIGAVTAAGMVGHLLRILGVAFGGSLMAAAREHRLDSDVAVHAEADHDPCGLDGTAQNEQHGQCARQSHGQTS